MLKKLNFDLRTLNYSKGEFNIHEFITQIGRIYDNILLYNFDSNDPCYVHLLDKHGNVFYSEKICQVKFNNSKLDSVFDTHLNLCREWLEFKTYNEQSLEFENGDLFITLYYSKNCVKQVNIPYTLRSINESKRELDKMLRDINWFEDTI